MSAMFQNVEDDDDSVREAVRIINNVDKMIRARTNLKQPSWKTICGYLASIMVDLHKRNPKLRTEIEKLVGVFTDDDVSNIQ
jgi:hypothetical protein